MIALGRIVLNRAARFLIALVLLAAAISKALSFAPFVLSVSRLAAQPQDVALGLAALLIGAESVTAFLLFSGRFLRTSAALAGILFIMFAAVLSLAVIRGISIPCQCFGAMGPRLSPRDQAVIDLVLALLSLFLIRPEKNSGNLRIRARFHMVAGSLTLVAILWAAALIIWPRPPAETDTLPWQGPSLLSSLWHEGVVAEGRTTVVVLTDFDEFGCQLCLDDFLAMCDSLNAFSDSRQISVLLIARRDTSRSNLVQSRMLTGWAAGNRYAFPVLVDRDSLFERSGITKTSIFLFDREGVLIAVDKFPLGEDKRRELLAVLKP